MSQHFHAVVWVDHHEARVFHFNADEVERAVVHPLRPTRHIHHKSNSVGSGHSGEDQVFFHAVVDAIGTAGAILIGLQLTADYWSFLYLSWIVPLVRVSVNRCQPLSLTAVPPNTSA